MRRGDELALCGLLGALIATERFDRPSGDWSVMQSASGGVVEASPTPEQNRYLHRRADIRRRSVDKKHEETPTNRQLVLKVTFNISTCAKTMARG
jgi:hypothetical protein